MTDERGRGSRLVMALVAGIGLLASLAPAQEPPRKPRPAVVKQEAIGDMACAPCAVLNMVVSGSDNVRACGSALPGDTPEQRVRALIDTHGSKPSTTYAD